MHRALRSWISAVLTNPRRAAVNAFLLILLPVLALDALPHLNRFDAKARDRIDPVLDASGLWQDGWSLFAPNVDKVNGRLSAKIVFDDGAIAEWRSPDWPKLSKWQKFKQFRRMEFYDDIRLDSKRGAWRGFALYIANTTPHPNGADVPVASVELTRAWARIPAPHKKRLPAGPYVDFSDSAVFYTWHAPKNAGSSQ